jgi:hypothetical protein
MYCCVHTSYSKLCLNFQLLTVLRSTSHAAIAQQWNADTPCWKAFDGTAPGAWRTAVTIKHVFALTPAQYITLDLGAQRGILPTAIALQCSPNASDQSGERECPRSWTLSGSNSSLLAPVWTELLSKSELSLADYPLTAQGWGRFEIDSLAAVGRPLGDRCASCDVGPAYTCALAAADSSCVSGYCSSDGMCATMTSSDVVAADQASNRHINIYTMLAE